MKPEKALKLSDTLNLAAVDATSAAHVLGALGEPGGMVPGSFTTKLIEAACVADPGNLDRLRGPFPGLIAAVYVYKYTPSGPALLREIVARSLSRPTPEENR